MNINRFYPTVDEALSVFEEDTLLHEPGSKYLYPRMLGLFLVR